jgi:hypothetical protein
MVRRFLLALGLLFVFGSYAWADPEVTLYGYQANPVPNSAHTNCTGTLTYSDINTASAGDVAFWQCAYTAEYGSGYKAVVTLTGVSGD